MSKDIIDRLTVLAESYEDAELDSCKPTAGVLRQAVARIAELEQQVAELSKDKAIVDAICEIAKREDGMSRQQAIDAIHATFAEFGVGQFKQEQEHE